MAAVCDSFGIVHHDIKQFICRAALYATSRVSYERRALARITLIEIYRNAFPARPTMSQINLEIAGEAARANVKQFQLTTQV